MNDAPARRMAAMSGIAIAAAVALWWLGSTRLALDRGSDAGRSAADALQSLWLVRGMAVAMLSVRVGALQGWRAGVETALGMVAPAWPVAALAWSATATPWPQLAMAECALLAACIALPWLGSTLRRALRRAELALIVATALGCAVAASLWVAHGSWALTPA